MVEFLTMHAKNLPTNNVGQAPRTPQEVYPGSQRLRTLISLRSWQILVFSRRTLHPTGKQG